MRKITYPTLLSFLLFASFPNEKSYAVPAKPGPVTMESNGDTITVYLHGDEHFHYCLSEDGYLLAEHNGRMEFATVSVSGILTPSGIQAAPPHQRTFDTSQFLRSIDRHIQLQQLELGRRLPLFKSASRSPSPESAGLYPGQHFPAKGEQRAIVVLIEYADVEFNIENPLDYFSRMLNEEGFSDFSGTGSAKDYFIENSCGQFQPTFDVFGPVKLSNKRSFYGGNDLWGNDQNPELMVIEACQQLDATVDFSQYDRNGDGFIDNVFVFYAGRGEASGGTAETVWPHSWNITKASSTPYIFDGVQLDYYACTNEWTGTRPDGIGTFVHEFSHVMGLPDLYHTTNINGAFTPGNWSVLDHGPYNNNGCTPPFYSAFERNALGWGEPVVIDKPQNATLPPIGTNTYAIIPTPNKNEYFLLENRQQNSWDTYIPGHGMLIWHIDYNEAVWNANRVNNNRDHQYVDIEEADGTQDNYSRDADAFPGTAGITSFTDNTTPSMLTWNGTPLNTPLTEITEDIDGTIRFKIKDGREPIPTVRALPPSSIEANGFTACWESAGSTPAYYRLTIYCKTDNGIVSNTKTINVTDATSVRVDGLIPDTRYYYTVAVTDALEISDASNEIETYTGHLTIDNFAVKALQPDAATVSENAFTARWLPLDDANAYHISVYTKIPGDPLTDECPFDNKLSLPQGWQTTATSTYSMGSYAGNAIPSLRLGNGQWCATPTYPADVKEITFWHRGNATSTSDIITVTALTSEKRVPVATLPIETAKGGKTETVSNLPTDTKSVEIAYTATTSGSLAIDDITVKWGNSMVPQHLRGYHNLCTDMQTELFVEGLIPDTEYFYTVTATDGTLTSMPSEEIAVRTTKAAAIDAAVATGAKVPSWEIHGLELKINIPDSGGECSVCDISGRIIGCLNQSGIIAMPTRGIYIISCTGTKPAIIRL